MGTNRPTGVGLAHPTVVPENAPDIETGEHAARCPACGRPLDAHATTDR